MIPVPFTGWGADYKYIFGKVKYLRITKKKIMNEWC